MKGGASSTTSLHTTVVHIVSAGRRRAKVDAAVSLRRRQVTALWRAGLRNQVDIARQLGVNQSTVSRDLAALKDEWRTAAAADVAIEKGLELARLDNLHRAIWPAAISGDPKAIDAALAIMGKALQTAGSGCSDEVEHHHGHDRHGEAADRRGPQRPRFTHLYGGAARLGTQVVQRPRQVERVMVQTTKKLTQETLTRGAVCSWVAFTE
jgi:DNA-binding CsgD family transcriptional regulator